jgi:mannose-6-phosphate isomerase-like protein (cupin superfamily)
MADMKDIEGKTSKARVLKSQEGEIIGAINIVRDRFMINGHEYDGHFALVEHLMPPRTLAAPLHRHTKEDEFSYVLEGRVGAQLGEEVVFGEAGDLIFKPRNQWHTFWNDGDKPARILEIISPGGFETAFREMDAYGEELSPETMTEIANRYGVDVDFKATGPIIEHYRLVF